MDRIKFLINILNNASKCYYSGKTPIMDDVEYDKLFDELKYLENTTGIVYSNSPTQNVGSAAIDYLEKIEHSSPMLSLDKCHSTEELKKFIGKENGILMMKMDGLTVRATYRNGNIFRLETRGDGVVGNDVTHLIGNFVNLPISIPIKTDFIVDGECIITYDDFLRINDKLPIGTEKYKNLDMTLVFYSAPHDVKKDIESIYSVFGERRAVAVKEITKLHERAERFNLSENLSSDPKGDYVILVEGGKQENQNLTLTEKEHIEFYIKQGIDKKEALKRVAKERCVSKSSLYKYTID